MDPHGQIGFPSDTPLDSAPVTSSIASFTSSAMAQLERPTSSDSMYSTFWSSEAEHVSSWNPSANKHVEHTSSGFDNKKLAIRKTAIRGNCHGYFPKSSQMKENILKVPTRSVFSSVFPAFSWCFFPGLEIWRSPSWSVPLMPLHICGAAPHGSNVDRIQHVKTKFHIGRVGRFQGPRSGQTKRFSWEL